MRRLLQKDTTLNAIRYDSWRNVQLFDTGARLERDLSPHHRSGGRAKRAGQEPAAHSLHLRGIRRLFLRLPCTTSQLAWSREDTDRFTATRDNSQVDWRGSAETAERASAVSEQGIHMGEHLQLGG